MHSRFAALLALILGAASLPGAAQWAAWDYDFDQEKKSWKEIQAQIPAYPQAGNLVPLDVGRGTGHLFYVDAGSISRGEDGVMRYTAVIKAAGGAMNVSFEGMRCETRERKVYAFGRPDGTWVRARDPGWTRVAYTDAAPHQGMLFRDYFCPSRFHLPRPQDVVTALKRGEPVNPATQMRE